MKCFPLLHCAADCSGPENLIGMPVETDDSLWTNWCLFCLSSFWRSFVSAFFFWTWSRKSWSCHMSEFQEWGCTHCALDKLYEGSRAHCVSGSGASLKKSQWLSKMIFDDIISRQKNHVGLLSDRLNSCSASSIASHQMPAFSKQSW